MEVIEIIARSVMIQPDELSPSTNLKSINWDSMAQLEFIAACDEILDINLDTDALSKAQTIGDLIEIAKTAR